MEAKEIIEGNELIAEFMGAYLNDRWKDKPTYTYKTPPSKDACYNWGNDEMQYQTSWDWLMPVVEKIESLRDGKAEYNIIIFKRCCDIQDDNSMGDHLVEITAAKDKITAVWLAVTKFIQWYNQTT